jgi:molybdate/tungstate transport system substrate-binding protein
MRRTRLVVFEVRRSIGWIILAALAAWLGATSACRPAPPAGFPPARKTLRVFCAGSLIIPFARLEEAFEAAHPEIDVQNECHGSIQVIRHVTELHEPIDIVATADYTLIPLLMYSTSDPVSGRPYASWYIRFAGNRMALAYTRASRFAGEIQAGDWFEMLSRPGVKLGLADPRFDAAGYRALMVLTLAEDEYGVKGLHDRLVRDAFTWPVTRFLEAGFAEISVPEIVEPVRDSNITLRGGSIQLLALLESGDIDYAFEYESVIAQHTLLSVSLPEAINLGAEALQDQYARVQVKLDFQRFSSVKPVFRGEPIGYGITIPSNAPEPELAELFLAFLLSPEGRAVMEAAHQPLLNPVECDHLDQIPLPLRAICPAAE